MSDAAQGPDWWLGADGKWYPPVARAEAAEPPKDSKRLRFIIAGVVVILALAGVGFFATRSSEKKYTLVGAFQLRTTSMALSGPKSCHGTGGYSDIEDGVAVTLSDGDGKVVATSHLENGTPDEKSFSFCTFGFTLKDVPKRDFYKLEISHRGQITYSYDDLNNSGWLVSQTLGS